jgi:hypothetical protein
MTRNPAFCEEDGPAGQAARDGTPVFAGFQQLMTQEYWQAVAFDEARSRNPRAARPASSSELTVFLYKINRRYQQYL